MENAFKCSLQKNGICLDFGVETYLMSYEETMLPYDEAKEWVQERGGNIFPCKHSITFAEHADEINSILEANDKQPLNGWLWTDREHATKATLAWVVLTFNGYVGWTEKNNYRTVRAVSALQK